MKRRITILAIATFISSSLMAGWDGTKWTPEEGPYTITSTADLIALASQVNAGNTFSGKTFIQTADIDLGGVQDAEGIWSGTQWSPIGNNKKPFSGTYDGNGKVINNLYYNNPSVQYTGLFGYIKDATLTNITIASGFVYGYQHVAGICAAAVGNSTISFCANCATVYGKMERNGGICGWASAVNIHNCINYGLISGFNFTGGIIGLAASADIVTTNCINVGQVFAMRCTSGNVIGFNNNTFTPSNCYYDNQINPSIGIAKNNNEIETDTDQSGIIEGKTTSELSSGTLLSGFDDNIWDFTSGIYPRLIVNKNNDAIKLAASPIFLSDGNKADSVATDFYLSAANSVIWTSGNTDNLSIKKDNINYIKDTSFIKRSTAIVLIGTKSGYTKRVYLKTNMVGKTPIG